MLVRSVQILSHLSLEGDAAARQAADNALNELAASSDRRVAAVAQEEIGRQQMQWIARLEQLGEAWRMLPASSPRFPSAAAGSKTRIWPILRHFPRPDIVIAGRTRSATPA